MNLADLPLGAVRFYLVETREDGLPGTRQPFVSEELAESHACFLRQHGSSSSFCVVPADPVLPGMEGA